MAQTANGTPEPLIELVAHRFRVLGETQRIRLLDHLRDGPANVAELRDALGLSQQNVSKHLAILHDAGLIHREKRGTRVIYSVQDPTVFELCELVCDGVRHRLHALAELAA